MNIIYTAAEFLVCGSTIQALPLTTTDTAGIASCGIEGFY